MHMWVGSSELGNVLCKACEVVKLELFPAQTANAQSRKFTKMLLIHLHQDVPLIQEPSSMLKMKSP